MIDASIQKLSLLRGSSDEMAYLKQVKACIGAIGRIPNGALRGHVNRDDIAASVSKLISELDSRIDAMASTGSHHGDSSGKQLF